VPDSYSDSRPIHKGLYGLHKAAEPTYIFRMGVNASIGVEGGDLNPRDEGIALRAVTHGRIEKLPQVEFYPNQGFGRVKCAALLAI
jgi:hypothetical protein